MVGRHALGDRYRRGPAFEASAGRDCIPAEAGAVVRVREGEGGALECDIIAGDEPRGFAARAS